MRNTITHFALLFIASLLTMPSFLGAQVFKNPIPIPYQMPGNSYSIDIVTAMHNFDPNGFVTDINLNVPLEAYSYNERGNSGMTYLGPTLVFKKGQSLDFDILNNLSTGVSTTVHWHGLNIPARMDGGPHQVIKKDSTWKPAFPVIDPVQTIWYHTHLMDQTTVQVIRGLAGMIIVEDPTNDPLYSQLPRNYGENDFPIIIQEKGFVLDSSTTPPTATAIKAGEKPGNGPYTLVNGVVGGYLRVPPEIVRLRVLNGSPRKMFNIGLSTQLHNPTNFADMWMVATGGGYTDFPRSMDSSMMSIGDRREFLVDFSLYPDKDTIYMTNLTVPSDAHYGKTPGSALMAFIVDDALFPPNPIISFPATLVPYALEPGPVFKTRTKNLMNSINPPPGGGGGGVWTIDGTPMDLTVINDTVLVNTKERWVIHNLTSKAHPFHIHKVQFQVVEYEGLIGAGTTDSNMVYTYPNLPNELFGYKDVQLIRAGATLTFEARFDSFPSPLAATEGFMYHCHILTHEDTSMMHQFVVVDSVDFYTGLSNTLKAKTLLVYPNPAQNTLSFEGTFDRPGKLRFYDLSGRVLREDEVSSLTGDSISVADLPRGIIIVAFTSGEDHYIQKVTLY